MATAKKMQTSLAQLIYAWDWEQYNYVFGFSDRFSKEWGRLKRNLILKSVGTSLPTKTMVGISISSLDKPHSRIMYSYDADKITDLPARVAQF